MSDGGQIPPIADEKGRSTLIRVERPKGWVMGGGANCPHRERNVLMDVRVPWTTRYHLDRLIGRLGCNK